ncbi:NAD-dependent epimerase/dehydratase family protein [Thalassococcus lentus]|uniref:NAD(P)-dependent oxidoreductase n=1 Tax=Thalassococcus lentus TaxID=1210524 RepID=A0ABT4XMX9_9RHOB|nr:NAD(P)-dependent oxidoreductase [Thalassococcus lentus]MDA7423295.1 NAD(P)-dependent oxidoreductase [Thalassococcus lentus]
MNRILITGATGFLGGKLALHLHSRGCGVVACGRDPKLLNELRSKGIETLQFDLAGGLPSTLPEPVDAVVHCAALSSPWGRRSRFEAANVVGTRTALALASALNSQRFVNISSPSVTFALRDQLDVLESDPLPRPFNAYAATKAAAEALVHARPDLNPITLRPRGIYGAGETTLLPRLIAAARRGPLPLFRDGAAAIDLTHVSDVVRAIELALERSTDPQDPIYNVSSGEVLPIRNIVESACRAHDIAPKWRALPFWPALAIARAAEFVSLIPKNSKEPRITPYAVGLFAFQQSLSLSKARDVLGWTPKITFEQGLSQTVGKGAV